MEKKARHHEVRRAILGLLAGDEGEEMTVRELRNQLPGDIPESVVTYHLGALRKAGLVSVTPDGQTRRQGEKPQPGA